MRAGGIVDRFSQLVFIIVLYVILYKDLKDASSRLNCPVKCVTLQIEQPCYRVDDLYSTWNGGGADGQ